MSTHLCPRSGGLRSIDGHRGKCRKNAAGRLPLFGPYSLYASILMKLYFHIDIYPTYPVDYGGDNIVDNSRHDEEYTKERRGELQKYLQILFKTHNKVLIQKSKVLQSFLEFKKLIDIMISRREMLMKSSGIDGDTTPPSDSDGEDSEYTLTTQSAANDNAYADDQEYTDDKEEKEKANTQRSMFDIFSMSTGVWGNVTSASNSPTPRKEPPPPLKSCLKKTSLIGVGDSSLDSLENCSDEVTVSTTEAKEATAAKATRKENSVSINPLEEIKDFVRILIL